MGHRNRRCSVDEDGPGDDETDCSPDYFSYWEVAHVGGDGGVSERPLPLAGGGFRGSLSRTVTASSRI